MTRSLNKLSDRKVKTESKPGRHADGGGLYLEIKPSGSRAWLFMWKLDGKRTAMGLGSYPAVSLANARDKATDCRRIVAAGRNPLEESRKEAVPTFGEVADKLLASMGKAWKNAKHRDQWYYTLSRRRDDADNLTKDGYCLGLIDKLVDQITTDDVLSVLTPIWSEKAETASRLRGRIENVLAYAKALRWRQGENPALWRGHLSTLLPKRQKLQRGRHAAMPYADVAAFMALLRDRSATSARALEFTILTASRSGEVYQARWPEIDLDKGIWTVPAERMKAGREHRVPLSKRAMILLHELYEVRLFDDGFVFPGQKLGEPLSSNAMDALLQERMKLPQFTVHGFRSCFKDWATDETSHQREIIEAALAHVVGDHAEQAYRRTDALAKRRRLMDDWTEYCSKGKSNVVALVA
ncbi:MAG: site-specific integrase [Mesorhizobium sp.]|uniref:tyrosine-type recombinase/integrase n=1 Tax=Mesorhizobium sp. TaxID=1871066 RepID=UPI000FEA7333|nr:site-specific integrase [Mesorhizobium sp.]RWL79412.1 MAG: site-specific integrase [Mesorhizobium sp.]RWL83168.1 MAG: site-specific integrase [Mesorhizobium sp.]RWL93978.1 MAG: site-specific integrase [Mesorhizobium sp.]